MTGAAGIEGVQPPHCLSSGIVDEAAFVCRYQPAFFGKFNHRRGKYACPHISQPIHFAEYTDSGVRPDQNLIPFKRTTREADASE